MKIMIESEYRWTSVRKELRRLVLTYGSFDVDDLSQLLGHEVIHPTVLDARWTSVKTIQFHSMGDGGYILLPDPDNIEVPMVRTQEAVWTVEFEAPSSDIEEEDE